MKLNSMHWWRVFNNVPQIFVFCTLFVGLMSCQPEATSSMLISKIDDETSLYAYYDERGNKILGDYMMAYTDTITDYGIVADSDFVLIDKKGKHIHKVFPYDNGPDYASEGLIRIIENGKIGYIDSKTFKVLIEPAYACAYPFENGKARVSLNCKTEKASPGEEHSTWQSQEWFYIDKSGKVVVE